MIVLMGRYGKMGLTRRPKRVDRDKAYEVLKLMGITQYARSLVYKVSGGEQQKVALARALAQGLLFSFSMNPPPVYIMNPVPNTIVVRQKFVSLSVIPGLTRNPVFLNWIPAGVYPVLDTGRE
jgi:hypothetical protein